MKIFWKYFLLTHFIISLAFFARQWVISIFLKDDFVNSFEIFIFIFANIFVFWAPFFAIWWHYFKNNPQYQHQIFKKIFVFLAKILLLYGIIIIAFSALFNNTDNYFKTLIPLGAYAVFWLLVHEFFF